MSTINKELMLERFGEIRAAAALEQLQKRLAMLGEEPSAKRFVRTREARLDTWSEVGQLALSQMESLKAVNAPRKTVKKAKGAAGGNTSEAKAPATPPQMPSSAARVENQATVAAVA